VVDTDCQNKGERKTRHKGIGTENQSVYQNIKKIRGIEETLKVVQAHPGTAPDSQPWGEALKRHGNPVNRDVVKDKHVDKRNEDEEIEMPGIQNPPR
jgi:hypothetical protein